jgi:hypothetical protein
VPGSTWTLSLQAAGEYSLTTRGCFEKDAEPIESGHWIVEDFTLVLKSEQKPVGGSDYRHLYVLRKKSGAVMLVSALRSESYLGEPDGTDILFDHVFVRAEDLEKILQNQLPLPTPASGTPAAGAPVAPPSSAGGR